MNHPVMFLTETRKRGKCHNHSHNALRLFDVLPNCSFTSETIETMRDY